MESVSTVLRKLRGIGLVFLEPLVINRSRWRKRWRSARIFGMTCVLTDSPRILAFLVPLLPPAPHLLDLTLLGAHDVPCEPLYAWVLTLLVGHSAISLADRW